MTIYYAADLDEEIRATVSGIHAFSSITERDDFVDACQVLRTIIERDSGTKSLKVYEISEIGADVACRRSHNCTAREAHQKGLI
jgi:hypothetical protein